MDSTKYTFTTTWFQNTTKGTWDQLIPTIDPHKYLEIGAYEGASICFIIDTIAPKHPIHVFAVDTWEGGVEHNKDEMPEVEQRFDKNLSIAMSNYPEDQVHLTKLKGYSDDVLISTLAAGYNNYFDLVYVDGSHMATDVLSDAILAFKLTKVGGHIIFDDYFWRMQLQDGRILNGSFTKLAIDAFINIYFEKIEMVRIGEQVIIKKVKN